MSGRSGVDGTWRLFSQAQRRTSTESLIYEPVAVDILTLEGDEKVAFSKRPCIDRHTFDLFVLHGLGTRVHFAIA